MTQPITGGTTVTLASVRARDDVLTDLLMLSLIAALVVFPALGQTQYLANRELRHAEISREMAERHDYVVPHLLGTPYPDKPPSMHVAAAAFMQWAGGPSVWLARLPSALAALAVTLLTYGVGRVLADRRVGLVSALALLALPGFTIMARQALPDMVLCLAITASALALALGLRQRERRRGAWFVVAGIAAGLGVITKGPYGVVFPLFFAVLVLLGRPGWRRPRGEWMGFVAALLATAGAWAVPAYLRDGGGYLHDVIFQPDLDVTRRASDWYGLLVPALLLCLPMGIFLPMAVRDVRRHGYSAPLAVAAAIFLVVQAFPKKRPHYLLPMYPFLAVGLAATIVRHAADSKRVRRWACVAIAVGAALVPLYFGVIARWVEHAEDPDLRAAREILARAEPAALVHVLVRLDEALAWVGRDDRRIVWIDVEDPRGVRRLREAPPGSYLVIADGQQALLSTLAGEVPVRAVTTLEWPRRRLDQIVSLSRRTDRRLILLRVGEGPAPLPAR